MSPLNRGSPLDSRILPAGARTLPPPRFGGRPPAMLPQHGGRIPLHPPRMPSPPPRMRRMPPMPSPMFGPGDPRQRIPPQQQPPPPPPRAGGGGGGISRLNGGVPPPLFPGGRPRTRGHPGPPIDAPPPGMGPRGPPLPMRPWLRRMMPQPMMPFMRPMRYNPGSGLGTLKGKHPIRSAKKVNNRVESDLIKKPWMTDEICQEIQKKTRLYLRAKKYQNKNTIEWQEFRDTRNRVTRMIRDAKNQYLAKHPEQGGQKTRDNNSTIDSEGVQKTVNSTEQTDHTEEKQPSSEQAQP